MAQKLYKVTAEMGFQELNPCGIEKFIFHQILPTAIIVPSHKFKIFRFRFIQNLYKSSSFDLFCTAHHAPRSPCPKSDAVVDPKTLQELLHCDNACCIKHTLAPGYDPVNPFYIGLKFVFDAARRMLCHGAQEDHIWTIFLTFCTRNSL